MNKHREGGTRQPAACAHRPATGRPPRVAVATLVNTTTLAVTTILLTALEPKLPIFHGD